MCVGVCVRGGGGVSSKPPLDPPLIPGLHKMIRATNIVNSAKGNYDGVT